MASAIAQSLADGEHLLVQAGTGTGKSLGYLAPVLAHIGETDERVIIATATLALQHQLADKDIPAALAAVEAPPAFAVLKGRSNYACLLKVREGGGFEQDSLFAAADLVQSAQASSPESALGAEVLALREWAEEQLVQGGLADRDDAPTHGARGWAQVSVPARECLGVQKCPYGSECFVESSRDRARAAKLIVTNHALLAINAMHGGTALPEHEVVVIDEAHELVSRVTSAATNELSPAMIERVARRASAYLTDDVALDFLDSADALRSSLAGTTPGQLTDPGHGVVAAVGIVRDAARAVVSGLSGDGDPERMQAGAAAKEIFDFADRMAALRDGDVVWVSESELLGKQVVVAPLSVASVMRDRVLAERTVVMTSATLSLGGSFDPVARSVGLRAGDEELSWQGIDVGSPFDYRRQGILYIARDLPQPGRDGIGPEVLAQVAELVWAAGGRTLGLFASRRAAEAAASHVRRELPGFTVLCQGDAQLSELTRRFIAEPESCLFGTVSLWQGVDVPGDTCQLVIIDKIPFPRPDDPLMQARQQAVAKAGGNGFMTIAATHAALLLAQGAGRLIRRSEDRGVVAVLDPRLATARYGGFLRASMPGFWTTYDAEVAIGSLRRLTEARENGSS
ncbi:MAG: ATP-dependent DNA helicase [Propionibacteriaceae bacterium]|nr:ATP-dependent DNA helicase [Propionibacteriaceae bacterium]